MSQTQLQMQNDNKRTLETVNPTTGDVYKKYFLHDEDDAKDIADKAHNAFLSWRNTSFEERAEIIVKVAAILERDKTELAEMMARQMGKPVAQGEGEIDLCIGIAKYTAEQGPKVLKNEERDLEGGQKGIITYQPLGVILGMQPWNFPFYQCIRYSLAVIMGGNTTVFKHAGLCFETAERIQKIYEEAGLPEDVFSVIYANGETADSLISHEKIRGVTYTGSARVGKVVAQEAGKYLKKTVMELGGSDAYIILKDADIDAAIKTCVEGRVNNAGQTCVAAKRFIIEEDVYDAFKDKYVAAMKDVTYGDPMDRGSDMGPLSTFDLRDRVHNQVQDTVKKGAECLCGGEMPDGEGAFYPATVLANIPQGTPAYEDEIFGPVASLFKVKDAQAAIDLANDHRYGLGGGIFSQDTEKAIDIACNQLDTGMVNVNGYGAARPNMPFGGVKESGYGREHGGFGLKEFMNIKSVCVL